MNPIIDRRRLLTTSGLGAVVLATVGPEALFPSIAARGVSAWGGHSNGRIPASALSPVPAGLGPALRSDAAAAYFALNAAFVARFGTSLSITEAYRDYNRQQYLYDGWYHHRPGFNLAAPPGTSKHGWALACDFGSGVNRYGTPQKIWMDQNAPRYGWVPAGNGFSSREPWHFEYTGSFTPTPPAPPEDDLPYSEAQLKLIIRDAMIGILRSPEFSSETQATKTARVTWDYQVSDLPGHAWQALRDARNIARRAEQEAQAANQRLDALSALLTKHDTPHG